MERNDLFDGREITRIVETYADMLLRIAMNRVRSVAEAEDIVQSVYVRLMTARPRFRDAAHERAWLIRVAVNLCKDWRKSAARRSAAPLNEQTPADVPAPSLEVLDAVWRLPENDRYAVYLYYYEDLTVRDVARVLGEPEGTVSARLSRARKKLEKTLKGDGYGAVSERV